MARIDSRQRIMEAYERAKTADPSLTQGQFMRHGAPGYELEGAPGKFKNDDSAARYFRKIRSGERSGAAMYESGRGKGETGNYQLRARLFDGRIISQNIAVAGGTSSFDVPAIEHQLKTQRAEQVEAMILHYQSRYGMESTEVDMESVDVRLIQTQKKRIRLRMNIVSNAAR